MRIRSLMAALRGAGLVVIGLGAAASACAAEVLVTAEFAPSALDPGRMVFRNTTPRGTYCSWRPDFCTADGAYSIDVPLQWSKTHEYDSDIRKRFYLGLPAPRAVMLRNTTTGIEAEVRIAIATVSGHLTPGGTSNPVNTVEVLGGCSYVRTGGNGSFVMFGWTVKNPEAPTPCWSRGTGGLPQPADYAMSWFGLGLLITAPSPLSLTDGIYEGELTYTAGGAGSDIDFGDDVTTEPITLKFRFTVSHQFQVRFPSDNPQVHLAPEAGWAQWTDQGRAPIRLYQELPFHLTSSMDFSMKLRCEHDAGNRCGIRNQTLGEVVPVDVGVTLPGMRNLRDGRPAQDTPLSPDDEQAPRFTPDGYLMQRRSTLRFTAGRDAVTEMLKAPGSHWEGNMTVVFDANP
ncbi:hypothetical protein [uncultured Stenotrophomonas sp.]|uniref:hypothetical protein n=1 Tax=uncultured Stenotrophomonas sp. TaxID=165438 RepID=UPI00258FFE1F|nr:hypothetical protein [uncultured Stenotrophomonas sp.]